MRMPLALLPLALVACGAPRSGSAGAASEDEAVPVELGTVAWHRDFDAALELAARQDKPVMLVFQEVPG